MQTKFKTLRIALLLALTMIVGAIQAQTISGHVKDATGEDVIGPLYWNRAPRTAL